jgi:hypothetical protein
LLRHRPGRLERLALVSGRRRAPRARVVAVAPDRFAAGWRLVPEVELEPPLLPLPLPVPPDLVVDLIRPADLVAVSVEGYDVELVTGANPRIRAKEEETGRLVVRLSYQHLGERAIYEGLDPVPVPDESNPTQPPVNQPAPGGEPPGHVAPIQARPAKTSRLVFEVPTGVEIAFSSAGILDALSRLPMLVHPLAKPREGRTRVPAEGPVFHLPDGLIATLDPEGLVVSRARRRSEIPDTATASGLSALARDGRQIRAILSTRSGTSVTGVALEREGGIGDVTIGGQSHSVVDLLDRAGPIRPDVVFRPRHRPTFSRPAEQFETAIEAPYRLVISPSALGGWTHATAPVPAKDAPHRIELWHTRLGARKELEEEVTVDERSSTQRVVRALWARDREGPAIFQTPGDAAFPNFESLKVATHDDNEPFRLSLDGADRHMLVRQSAETWLGLNNSPIPPDPVGVEGLWLSALGAWLDLHGGWTTLPYSEVQMASILLWDHVAPMGRDQYVRVVYPGYLYPFGHRATLVKVTERKMLNASPSIAGLFQRKFLVVGQPLRTYAQRDFPFTEVRVAPLVTPTLSPDPGNAQNSFFVPMVDNQRFRFVLHCVDYEGRPVRLVTPLVWVAEHFNTEAQRTQVEDFYRVDAASTVSADGQDIAYTPVAKGGDTVAPTASLHFDGDALLGTSRPRLGNALVEIPAVQRLSPVGPVTIQYSGIYLANGFGGAQNAGEVWAELPMPPSLSFGSPSAGSDRAGGFLQPDLPVAGLSRIKGTVGEVADTATGGFDPVAFLAGVAPKLFGIVSLVDLLDAIGVDLEDAPDVVAEALDRIEGFLADLERARKAAADAVAEANLLQQRAAAKAAELQQQAQQAVQAAQQLETTVTSAVDDVLDALAALPGATEAEVAAALATPLQSLRDATDEMEEVAPQLPPLIREQLLALASVLRTLADAADLIEDVFRFLNGLATGGVQASFRFEWTPKLKSWPESDPILELQERSLALAVDGRAAKDEMKVEVLAELKDFTLNLLPGAPLTRFKFDHLSFHAGSAGKPDVDVVLQDIEFLGILGFVETLRELIPFDGFSDPPFLDVTPEGLSAGFTLALPNVSVGVFNLSNMSLGADVQVPFLGKSVTVGFNFCTRERPFTLAVLFIGGGGWFLIRLSPDGLDVLEVGLEAGAILAVDFGVASGSISAMLGIYMRLEGDEGSLTGYFRLRGEVDVLGLISASIELYLELVYEFDTGKMTGRATLTIKVEVFVFSGSVRITAERQFAGSKGDPSFRDVMVLEDGTSPAWSQYCLAFAGE